MDIFIAYRLIGQANPAAAELLRLCAILQSDAIPEELLLMSGPEISPGLQSIAGNRAAFDRAISGLCHYVLLYHDVKARTFSVPSPVLEMLIEDLAREEQRQWVGRAVRLVSRAFQDAEMGSWPSCERYLPLARHCLALMARWQVYPAEAAFLFNQAGLCRQECGDYVEAESFYQLALQIFVQTLGSIHAETASCLQNLAELYQRQGYDEQSRTLYKRVLAIYELTLSMDHPRVARLLMHYIVLLQQRVAQMQKRLDGMRARLGGNPVQEEG